MRNELVSVDAARDDYGVVIDVTAWAVDELRTVRRRAELREQRGWTEQPIVTR